MGLLFKKVRLDMENRRLEKELKKFADALAVYTTMHIGDMTDEQLLELYQMCKSLENQKRD